ncbi:hypothetical protein OIO90_006419 [Microbotryomycetes sp. JL221]|nr:hypothetical protein OIO90_006419 [Microbotryomycetes sp. JL221]
MANSWSATKAATRLLVPRTANAHVAPRASSLSTHTSRHVSTLCATTATVPRLLSFEPRLLQQRARSFASSTISQGWIPSFQWGQKHQVATIHDDKTLTHDEATSATDSTPITTEVVSPAPPPPAPPVPSVTPTSSSSAVESTSDLVAAQTTESASSTATHTLAGTDIFSGTLDLTSLAGSWGLHPIMRLQSMFLKLHESFPILSPGGMPWYVLIPTVTIGLRILLFYFQVRAQANAARMARIQPQMLAGMEKVKQAKARQDPAGAQAAQMEVAQLMQTNKVNPLKNLVFPLAQASVFMCMFFAIRGLTGADIPSLMNEGAGWVQDLTKPDPYWALPLASTGLTLATLEFGVDSTTQVQTTTTKNMKLFFRVMLVVALPFIAYFPAALLLYWVSNNSISLLQSLVLKQPAVRSLFGIPHVPPKPQPGDANYVAEPSFTDAFKNMQMGAVEKWEETKDKAEKQRLQKEMFNKQTIKRIEMYEPQSSGQGRIARVVRNTAKQQGVGSLLEDDSTQIDAAKSGAQTSTIQAVEDKEADKLKRLAAARARRRRN